MRLEHYPVDKLKKEILEIVGNHLDLKQHKVFFFGSRVEGKGDERSDVDVGIEGAQPIPVAQWVEIQEAFENFPTLYKVEIVDFKRVAPIFKKVALKRIEIITNPSNKK